MEEIHGKVALVTGGAKRLGREICLSLARGGACLLIHYRKSRREAEELAEQIRRMGKKAWPIGCDLSLEGSWQTLLEESLQKAGRIDYLINSASSFRKSEIWEVSSKEFFQEIFLNAFSPFFLARRFARKLSQEGRKGCVVNILDSAILHFCPERAAYHLSKQILLLLTRSSALAFAPSVRVNAVAPGPVLPPEGESSSYLTERSKELPLKRAGTPEDVAQSVLFLLRSDFITGQVIFVDGGYHMKGRVYGT